MPPNAAVPGRAGDSERDATVEQLRGAVGSGRLDLDEFDARAARAYRAETVTELAELTADLAPPQQRPVTAGPVIARFGSIEVTATTVRAPSGVFPLHGSVWRCFDYWRTERVTPTWAIAAAVLGFLVVPFVSLLFLLVKEHRTVGVLQVCAWDGTHQHVVDLPVGNPVQARAIEHQVGYVAALARAA